MNDTALQRWICDACGIISALTLFSSMVTVAYANEDCSKLTNDKKTKLGLYMTSTQVYDYTMANGKSTLFITPVPLANSTTLAPLT